jgi:hypothetical protein
LFDALHQCILSPIVLSKLFPGSVINCQGVSARLCCWIWIFDVEIGFRSGIVELDDYPLQSLMPGGTLFFWEKLYGLILSDMKYLLLNLFRRRLEVSLKEEV